MVQSTVDWDQLDKRKFYTIGPALNLCTRAILYPTKLIKTRLQVQASTSTGLKYTGMYDALRKICKSEVRSDKYASKHLRPAIRASDLKAAA